MHSEPSQTSKMELFAKIVNGLKPLTVFVKSSILDVWIGLMHRKTKFYFKDFFGRHEDVCT